MKYEAKLVLPKRDLATINGYLTAEKKDDVLTIDDVFNGI